MSQAKSSGFVAVRFQDKFRELLVVSVVMEVVVVTVEEDVLTVAVYLP